MCGNFPVTPPAPPSSPVQHEDASKLRTDITQPHHNVLHLLCFTQPHNWQTFYTLLAGLDKATGVERDGVPGQSEFLELQRRYNLQLPTPSDDIQIKYTLEGGYEGVSAATAESRAQRVCIDEHFYPSPRAKL